MKFSTRVTTRTSLWLRSALIPLALLTLGADSGEQPTALSAKPAAGPVLEPFATVDGEELPRSRFNELWEASRRRLSAKDGHVPEFTARTERCLLSEQLIEEHLIERAAEQESVSIREEEVDADLDVVRGRFPDSETFDRYVATRTRGLGDMRQQLRIDRLRERLVDRRTPRALTEEEIRLAYDLHEAQFRAPGFLRVEEILVRTTATMSDAEIQEKWGQARRLWKQAQNPGADFAELMKTAARPGPAPAEDSLTLTPRNVPSETWVSLARVEPGGVSTIIQTEQGFHVFKIVERGAPVRLSFEIMKGEVAAGLERMRRTSLRMALQKELRDRAAVKNLLTECRGPGSSTLVP